MNMLCVFNPEHDLALANGGKYYVPPVSALRFAQSGCRAMQHIYGDDAVAVPAFDAAMAYETLRHGSVSLIPWGWNIMLKTYLVKQGVPEPLMPSDALLSQIRTLQHRSSFVELNPDARYVNDISMVDGMIASNSKCMFKAPWSGAGRGLRRIDGHLAPKDMEWCLKMIDTQGGFIVEPFYDVVCNFAVEYIKKCNLLSFAGYSLFETHNGVYQGNVLMSDDDIERFILSYIPRQMLFDGRKKIEAWLTDKALIYSGPIGVDMMIYRSNSAFLLNCCVEINFRHTMGLAAHNFLMRHPECEGTIYKCL